MLRFLLICAVLIPPGLALPQNFTIRGRVIDADTEEGVSFCNVFFEGTTTGVSSDLDGYYELTTGKLPGNSLSASAIGYQTAQMALGKDTEQTVNFVLHADRLTLSEVVVVAGENPANAIVRGIIANKERNRLEYFPNIGYQSYAKLELDFENVPPKLRDSKLMKPFAFIFENFDSTSDEKPFLPVYLNETVSNVYYDGDKKQWSEIVLAQRTSGVNNATIIDYIKKIYTPFSVYDNWIYILEKPFASPFSNSGLSYYEYYIIDSLFIRNQWSYQLKFKPKRKQENTFYGDFWVADSTFAIQKVNMRMSPDVNINLVNRIIIYQDFEYQQGSWLPNRKKTILDFKPAEKAPGMIGRHTVTFRDYDPDFAVNIPEKQPRPAPETLIKDEAYWQTARHEPLAKNEAGIYAMVDSLKNTPAYKTYSQVLKTLVDGYVDVGKLEFGPYFSIYNSNPVEGSRIRLGLRTSNRLSKKIRLNAYGAYGFRDEVFKYGAELRYLSSRDPRKMLGLAYNSDISQSNENTESFEEGDLFSGFLRRDLPMKLIQVKEAKAYFERYWNNGFSNRLTLLSRHLDPYGGIAADGGGFNFVYLRPHGTGEVDTTINTTELIIKTRFAFKEEFIDLTFDRASLGTKHPAIELQYTLGINDLLGSDYHYHKISLYYRHYFNINPVGWLSYRFRAGKVFGELPFLLLEVHPGNEAYFMGRGIFNTMNRYEFASDTYASLILEHHFDGYFLNKIPLMRKLKWREVISFKAVAGSLSARNREANRLNLFAPSGLDTYTGFRPPDKKPFMEVGVGIENIFKFLRVDAIWRLNYLDNPEASRFNVVGGMYFFF